MSRSNSSARLFDALAGLLLVLSVLACVGVGALMLKPQPSASAPGAVAEAQSPTAPVIASPSAVALLPTWPATWTAAPTLTPFAGPTPTPLLPGGVTPLPSATGSAVEAQVAADIGFLRLRQRPGTESLVIGSVAAQTPLDILGRTPDAQWLEVTTLDQQHGWAMAQYVQVFINVLEMPVTASNALEPSPTAIVFGAAEAQVSAEGQGLRVRQSPGTAGNVLTSLDALTPLDVQGRTADNVWLQIVAQIPSAPAGWVMRQYVDVFVALDDLAVTGTAVDVTAPPPTATKTSRPGASATAPAPTLTASVTPVNFVPSATAVVPPTFTHTPAPSNTPVPPLSSTPGQPPSGAFNPGLYLSGVSNHAREIYLAGQARGNRADVFSKVGDSITVYWQFLIRIGQSQYNLRDYGYLEEATQHFLVTRARNGNSYVNTSLAAKSGWSSFAVLAPSLADKTYCQTNESPLMCEYRLTRPAIALIMLGTNDIYNSYSNEGYEANLRRIVSDSIAMGVIPVLSTVPPFQLSGFEGRTEQINALVWKVAQENDIPVWDYHAALLTLPNQGLGSDGVHPSFAPDPADFTADNLQYGFAIRNLMALHILDTLWRQVMYP